MYKTILLHYAHTHGKYTAKYTSRGDLLKKKQTVSVGMLNIFGCLDQKKNGMEIDSERQQHRWRLKDV